MIVLQKLGCDVGLGRGELLPGLVNDLHDGIDKLTVFGKRLPADGKAVDGQPLPQLRPLALALQNQPVSGIRQPGSCLQNGDHGVAPHPGADQRIKFPGNVPHAVGEVKGHFSLDPEFRGVAHGALQGLLLHIRGDDGAGDALLQQIDAQIAVVTADVRHPIPGGNKAAAGQQAVGKGELHWVSS